MERDIILVVVNLNIYVALNQITKYIDEHLEEKIAYENLAMMMGVNVYTMQRIFSLMVGLTLADYIRKRRLSNAGYDLYEGNCKVMDVAIKYGYENATSFSRAFEAFHGIKPSMVSKMSKLKNYPRVIFNENVVVTSALEYEIKELDELKLFGVSAKVNNDNVKEIAPKFFREMEDKYSSELGLVKYAMLEYEDVERDICSKYYVLFDKEKEGLEKISIAASKWLSFRINSQEPREIQEMIEKFYGEFFPSCKYNLRDLPELEYYHDGVTDFLIAIY